jgi:Fic family protein
MDPSTFSETKPGRVLIIQEGAYAFIPDMLPPQLNPDWELTSALSEASAALSELAGVACTLPNPHLLIRPFVRKEAVLSSKIEGTQASLSDVMKYEGVGDDHRSDPGDVTEVINYISALEYGLDRITTLPVGTRLITEMHEKLMIGVRGQNQAPGELRRIQNWIGTQGVKIENATYVPPPASEVPNCLSDLERYIHKKDKLPPLIRLALIHYQFEAIHPFLDGNGRIGRLLITLLLCEWKLMPQPLLYLSAYFESNRRQYYDGLLDVSRTGNWNSWVLFFLNGISEQSRDAIQRSKRLIELWQSYREKLQSARVSGLLLTLVDFLFSQPIVSAARVEKALKVTPRSAQQNIDKLVKHGILVEMTGRQRNRIFCAVDVLRIVDSVD